MGWFQISEYKSPPPPPSIYYECSLRASDCAPFKEYAKETTFLVRIFHVFLWTCSKLEHGITRKAGWIVVITFKPAKLAPISNLEWKITWPDSLVPIFCNDVMKIWVPKSWPFNAIASYKFSLLYIVLSRMNGGDSWRLPCICAYITSMFVHTNGIYSKLKSFLVYDPIFQLSLLLLSDSVMDVASFDN